MPNKLNSATIQHQSSSIIHIIMLNKKHRVSVKLFSTDRNHLEHSQERMTSRLNAPPPILRSVRWVPAYDVVRGDTYLKIIKWKSAIRDECTQTISKSLNNRANFNLTLKTLWCDLNIHRVAQWLVAGWVDHVPQCLLWVLNAPTFRVSVPQKYQLLLLACPQTSHTLLIDLHRERGERRSVAWARNSLWPVSLPFPSPKN